jgi:hypothetical protein
MQMIICDRCQREHGVRRVAIFVKIQDMAVVTPMADESTDLCEPCRWSLRRIIAQFMERLPKEAYAVAPESAVQAVKP